MKKHKVVVRNTCYAIGVYLLFCAMSINNVDAALVFDPIESLEDGRDSLTIHSDDFDNDGDADLVTTHFVQLYDENDFIEGINIYLNDGDGTFTLKDTVEYSEYQVSVTSADFDNDGDIDLATANSSSDNLTVLLNDGTGNFEIESFIEIAFSPRHISSADFDNDGDIDIVAAVDQLSEYEPSEVPAIVVFSNNGSGQFATNTILFTQSPTSDLEVGDLDDDDKIDIVSGNSTISYFTNNHPTYTSTSLQIPQFSNVWKLVLCDIENDADIDILFSTGYEALKLYRNDGQGNFSSLEEIVMPAYGVMFEVADMDLDGDIDIIVPSSDSKLYIIYQDSTGSFSSYDFIGMPWLRADAKFIVKDFTGDIKPDIAIAITGGGTESKIALLFQEHIPTAAEQTVEAIEIVTNYNLPNSIQNSYLANLNNALQFIQNGQLQSAINQLNAFIHKVSQNFNQGKITLQQKNTLTSAAQEILTQLNSN
jgi:hypothetical protein